MSVVLPESAHAGSAESALAALQSSAAGLSAEEAGRRLASFGPNRLPDAPPRPAWLRFLGHFHNVLIYVLLASAVITALLGHVVDTAVILAVVLVNALIGFIQEGRAEQAMAALHGMLAPRSVVLRDGLRRSIDAADVVPGDVVLLEAGERVPADLRLLQARSLQIDEAILTGESLPVEKDTAAVAAEAALGDRRCLAYSGTLVTAGSGLGVAIATGGATELGRISGLLSQVETLSTPLVQQMDRFARWLTALILLLSAMLLGYGWLAGQMPFDALFMIVVGLAVAAIPEGLPAVLTITLAVGVQAMARRHAIVRRLPAIETVGAVSVICSDKTGTLTRNEMLAAALLTAQAHFTIEGEGYAPSGDLRSEGKVIAPAGRPLLRSAARIAGLCNDAALHSGSAGWSVDGDPMEGALKALSLKLLAAEADALQGINRTDLIPFDARHRYMAVLQHDHAGSAFIDVKGAPEQLLTLCAWQLDAQGQRQPLDRAFWEAGIERLAAAGQRVLALATRDVPAAHVVLQADDLEGQLSLVGLVGLIDPPRSEAIAAVAECRSAGIAVKMITGDHAGTAAAIAGQIGLRRPQPVLTGVELEAMDDASLAARVREVDVFARTSPEHKLRLVSALQSHGLTVAMTGDGVNDAPALKRADAGIAMGIKGSQAARESAELVLADDNFASIVAAVREGRTVYDNLRKVISWTLPTNAGEALTIIAALLFGLALPVTAVQILWINLITATTLGLALAFEPSEADVMRRPPRRRDQPLLDGQLVWHIVLVSLLFLAAVFGIYAHAVEQGQDPALARTMAVNTLVVLEVFHLFFIRNLHGSSLSWRLVRGTPVVWACVLAVTTAQFAVTYWPPLQRVFDTRAVPLQDGLLIVAVGVAFFAIVEVEKQVRLRWLRPGRQPAPADSA